MADRLNDGKKLGYFVSSYNSRPVLHFKLSGQDRAMTFVDAMEKYGHILRVEDLGTAYKRCGKSFKGQLGQHFVVLHDQPLAQQAQHLRREGGRGRGALTPTPNPGGRGASGRGGGIPRGNSSNRKRKYEEVASNSNSNPNPDVNLTTARTGSYRGAKGSRGARGAGWA